MKKRSVIFIIALIVVFLSALTAFVYEQIQKYPTPSYEVSDYETMAKLFTEENQIVFPLKDDLPDMELVYTVYLLDRFHYAKSGYLISGQDGKRLFEISCKDVSTLSEEEIVELSNHSNEVDFHGVGIKYVSGNSSSRISFLVDKHRYILISQNDKESTASELDMLAKRIIDQKPN